MTIWNKIPNYEMEMDKSLNVGLVFFELAMKEITGQITNYIAKPAIFRLWGGQAANFFHGFVRNVLV